MEIRFASRLAQRIGARSRWMDYDRHLPAQRIHDGAFRLWTTPEPASLTIDFSLHLGIVPRRDLPGGVGIHHRPDHPLDARGRSARAQVRMEDGPGALATAQKAVAAGCDDFIRKPYRDSEVFDALAKHLGIRFLYADEYPPTAEKKAARPARRSASHWSRPRICCGMRSYAASLIPYFCW